MGRLVPHLCLPPNFAFISAGIRTKKAAQAPGRVFALRLVLLPRLVVEVSRVCVCVCVEGVCHFYDYVSSIALSEERLLVYQYQPN